MMRILCWFGIHDWGKQTNIRDGAWSEAALLFPITLFAILIGAKPRVCDRKCLRCGKIKEFAYDSER
jgi:hypothetical protein